MSDDRERARELFRELQRSPDPDRADEIREFLGSEDPFARRSALDALNMVGTYDPSLLRSESERLAELLGDDNQEVRAGAAAAMASLGEMDPGSVPVSPTAELLDDDYSVVRKHAVEALRYAAQESPEAVSAHTDALVEYFDAPSYETRRHAVDAVATVSITEPESVVPFVPVLFERFREGTGGGKQAHPSPADRNPDGQLRQKPTEQERDAVNESVEHHRAVRQSAGHAVYEAAKVEPEAVLGYAGAFAELLSDDDPQVNAVAADIFAVLADDHPDVVVEHADALGDAIEVDAYFVNGPAAQALLVAADADPDAVRSGLEGHLETLADLLDHKEESVEAAAAGLFALLAEEDPSVVAAPADRLEALAESETDYVRAAAEDALSHR